MFGNRLRKTSRHLGRWARRQNISCYRLYERDIPEIPAIVDRYEDALHISVLARSASPQGADRDIWLAALSQAAAEALDIAPDRVFLKTRERQRGSTQYGRMDDSSVRLEAREGGHRFLINLSDYLDTGLFLDHRNLRARVQTEARGRRFLNLFAYTGAFTVYAAAGGAHSTDTVDLSKTYLDRARENVALNGLDGNNHLFCRADAFGFLRGSSDLRWDLVVVDPPTFSNSKRTEGTFDVQRDHVRLLRAVLRVMNRGGIVYFSTNRGGFTLQESAVGSARIEEITGQTVPRDFKRDPHRCWRMEAR